MEKEIQKAIESFPKTTKNFEGLEVPLVDSEGTPLAPYQKVSAIMANTGRRATGFIIYHSGKKQWVIRFGQVDTFKVPESVSYPPRNAQLANVQETNLLSAERIAALELKVLG